MVPHTALSSLRRLLRLVDHLPLAPEPVRRGRPCRYSERLFLKAVIVMVVRHVPTVHALVTALAEPGWATLRPALSEHGQVPSRRTFERRLHALPARLPAQIALVGEWVRTRLDPWAQSGRAVALDSTALVARGRVWHQRDRTVGHRPHTQIDPEAHWTHAGWHGWVYGYKLHLIVTVGAVWIPLAATLTAANRADNVEARTVLDALPVRLPASAPLFVLADAAYQDPALHAHCAARQRILVATQRGPSPHTDAGVEVRRIFHQLRTHAIETFNSQFKAIFDGRRPLPTKGLIPTQRWVLGAVLVYQLALLARFQLGASLRRGLSAFLHAT